VGRFERYLVLDLEATCDDAGAVPRQEMETIEIGAVLVNADTLRPEAEFQSFVRPIRHPHLTKFCMELTRIRQADVDRAPTFPEALERLCAAVFVGRDALFCSWGAYDRRQLQQDCTLHDVEFPLGDAHFDVKRGFGRRHRMGRGPGMAAALEHVGLELQGTHHRGIDDARNIARLLRFALPS
jgi:inhibitor of KinA sporulation pathway (predicted exonuclease)